MFYDFKKNKNVILFDNELRVFDQMYSSTNIKIVVTSSNIVFQLLISFLRI